MSVHLSVPPMFDTFTIGLYLACGNFEKYSYILQNEIRKPNQLNSTDCIFDALAIGLHFAYLSGEAIPVPLGLRASMRETTAS